MLQRLSKSIRSALPLTQFADETSSDPRAPSHHYHPQPRWRSTGRFPVARRCRVGADMKAPRSASGLKPAPGREVTSGEEVLLQAAS